MERERHAFFKGNILLSRRYQLHPASAPARFLKDIQDAHILETKLNKKEKKIKGLATMINSSQQQHTKHHQRQHTKKISYLQKRRLQEGTSAQAPSSPDPRS
jgi:hypothetical protein